MSSQFSQKQIQNDSFLMTSFIFLFHQKKHPCLLQHGPRLVPTLLWHLTILVPYNCGSSCKNFCFSQIATTTAFDFWTEHKVSYFCFSTIIHHKPLKLKRSSPYRHHYVTNLRPLKLLRKIHLRWVIWIKLHFDS